MDLSARKRVDACTTAINGKVEGFEMVLALWARSISRLEDGDVDGAIEDADRAADLHGQDYSVQNARCWARAVGNIELNVARQACTLAIRLAPGEASVYDSRGLVGLRQENWNDAWSDYDDALSLSPDFASALYGRGLAALGLGRIDDGEDDIAYALDLDPSIGEEYESFGIYAEDLAAAAPAAPRSTSDGFVGRAKQARDRQ
jgi:tetratricopeptide (TPR) repeat protein